MVIHTLLLTVVTFARDYDVDFGAVLRCLRLYSDREAALKVSDVEAVKEAETLLEEAL